MISLMVGASRVWNENESESDVCRTCLEGGGGDVGFPGQANWQCNFLAGLCDRLVVCGGCV